MIVQQVCYRVASFTGEACEGNEHLVFINQVDQDTSGCRGGSASMAARAAISQQLPFFITVFADIGLDRGRCSVCFYHGGREVKRCGSGSLALAYVLVRGLRFNPPILLETQSAAVSVGIKNNWFFFDMAVLPLSAVQIVPAWRALVDRPVQAVTLVGGKSDYCILELASEKAVGQCKVNAGRLCRQSRRALIVTAASARSGGDYVMRYFTPQYGQVEDRATGSANAMLAPYWQKKLNKYKVRGRQLSDSGGMFVVQKNGEKQRVYGRARQSEISPDLSHSIEEAMSLAQCL